MGLINFIRDEIKEDSSLTNSARVGTVFAALAGSSFNPASLEASTLPPARTQEMGAVPPANTEANPFIVSYRAMVSQPDFWLPIPLPDGTIYNLPIVKNGVPGSDLGTPADTLSRSSFTQWADYFFPPMFTLVELSDEQLKNRKLPEELSLGDRLPIIHEVTKTTDGKYAVVLIFNNASDALREVVNAILNDGREKGEKEKRAEVLPVTDAFCRVFSQRNQQVLATGYTSGIFNVSGNQRLTLLLTPKDFDHLCSGSPDGIITLIWHYRFANNEASYATIFAEGELDISEALSALRKLNGGDEDAPILLGNLDNFRRSIEGKIHSKIITNDRSLLSMATQQAFDSILAQAFTVAQTLTWRDFVAEYPEVSRGIAEYLIPQVRRIISSRGDTDVTNTIHQVTSSMSSAAEVGGSFEGVSFGIGGGLSRSELNQLSRTTGVTLQESESKDVWVIKDITFRHQIRGVHRVSLSNYSTYLVVNDPNASYTTTNPQPANFTDKKLERAMKEYLALEKSGDSLRNSRDKEWQECVAEEIELNALRKMLGESPVVELAQRLNKKVLEDEQARAAQGRSRGTEGARDTIARLQTEILSLKAIKNEQRKLINAALTEIYKKDLETYKKKNAQYEEAKKEHDVLIATLNKTHTKSNVGRYSSDLSYTEGAWVRLKNSPTRKFADEEHFAGIVTYFGKRPDNMAMLIRPVKGEVYETNKLMPGNAGGSQKVRNINDAESVINGVKCFYQGRDFDGWTFNVTEGVLDARLAGGMNPTRYTMPPLPKGFEWELCGIQLCGRPWVAYANLEFRVIFSDRDRAIPAAPVAPTKPAEPQYKPVVSETAKSAPVKKQADSGQPAPQKSAPKTVEPLGKKKPK